jgi:predicted aspartyl protease
MIANSRLLIVVIPTLIFLLLPSLAKADDPGGCFMITSSGQTISLGKLCGGVAQPNTGLFRVPIKRRSGKTPVIDVTFNGNQVFEMIVDTGASGTLITDKMAKALSLKPSGTINASIADGSEVQFQTGIIQTIAVSGAIANNLEVAIAPKADIGLLGHDFFDNYDIKIRQNTIEFQRRGN